MMPTDPPKRLRRPRSRRLGDVLNKPNVHDGEMPFLRTWKLGTGLPSLDKLELEVINMRDVLKGDAPAPIDNGVMTLQEVAEGYYARGAEIKMEIQSLERKGQVAKGSSYYKFRTGELATFLDIAKRAADLGSRRLTDEGLRLEREIHGRESKGGR